MKRGAGVIVATLAFVTVAVGVCLYFCKEAATPANASPPSTDTAESEAFNTSADDNGLPMHAPLPPMTADRQGTDVDGELEAGPDGHLLVTADIRHVFDYFLIGSGAESPEIIEARLFDMASSTLPPLAARDVRQLWRRYRAMRAEFAASKPDTDHTNPAGAVDALDKLTAKYFSPAEREALFGEELRDAHATVGPLQELQAAPDMPQTQRDAEWERVLEHEAPQERVAEARALRATKYISEEQELKAAGGDANALQRLRRDALGPEATARMEALDAQRAAWQARLDAFRSERDRLRADDNLADEEREAQVQRLIEQQFSAAERVRVHALVDRE